MIIKDADLGEIRLVANVRAKRIIVRRKENYLQLTYPPSVGIAFVQKTIEEMKPRLKSLLDKKPKNILFTPATEFETLSFKLKIIISDSTSNYYVGLKEQILSISCPLSTNFDDQSTQLIIRGFIEAALRREANRLLPLKVQSLAALHGFSYSGIKINKSRTRWGSCSAKKNINFSYYCMLLPEHLVNFIILHELCHTIHMNHGDNFWQLLDKLSDGKSKELTRDLKLFKTAI